MLNQSVMSAADCEQLCSILELEESQIGNQSRERFIAARIAALKDQKWSELNYLAQQMAEDDDDNDNEEGVDQEQKKYDNRDHSNLLEDSLLSSDLQWKQSDDMPQQFSKESDDDDEAAADNDEDIINSQRHNQQYLVQDKLLLFQEKFQNNFKDNKVSQQLQSSSSSSSQPPSKRLYQQQQQQQQSSQSSKRSQHGQQNLQSLDMQNFSTFNQRCQEQQDYLGQLQNTSELDQPQSIDFDNLFQLSENHQYLNNTFNTNFYPNNTSITQPTTSAKIEEKNFNNVNFNHVDADGRLCNAKYSNHIHNLPNGLIQQQEQYTRYHQQLEKTNLEDRLIAEMLSSATDTRNNNRNQIHCSKQGAQLEQSKEYQPTKFTQYFLKEAQQPQYGLVNSTAIAQSNELKNTSPGTSQSYLRSQLRIIQHDQRQDEKQISFMDQNNQRLNVSHQVKAFTNCQDLISSKKVNYTPQKSQDIAGDKENIQFMLASQNQLVKQQQQVGRLAYNQLNQGQMIKLNSFNNTNNCQDFISPSNNLNLSAKEYQAQEVCKPPLRFNINIAEHISSGLISDSRQYQNQKPTTVTFSSNCYEKEQLQQQMNKHNPVGQVSESRSISSLRLKNQQGDELKDRICQVNQEEQNMHKKLIKAPADKTIHQQGYSQQASGNKETKQQYMSVYERNQQFLREKELRQIYLREKYTSEELHHTFTPSIQPQSRDLVRNLKDLEDWKENLSQRNEKRRQKQVEEEIETMEVLQNEKLMCKGSERILQNSSRFLNKQKIEDKLIQSGMKYSARRQELDKQFNSNPARNLFKLLVTQNKTSSRGNTLNNTKNITQNQLTQQSQNSQNSVCTVSNNCQNQEILQSTFSPLRRDVSEEKGVSQCFSLGNHSNILERQQVNLKTAGDLVSFSQQNSRIISKSKTPERNINSINQQAVNQQQQFKQPNYATLNKTQGQQLLDTQQKSAVTSHQHGYKLRDRSEITGRQQEKMITEPNKEHRSQSSCQNTDQNQWAMSNQYVNLQGQKQSRGQNCITQNMKTEGNMQNSKMRNPAVEQQSWIAQNSQLGSTSRQLLRR